MEGKNCFRTKWSQLPLYSGGNISSLVLPVLNSSFSNSKREECLVTACGDTINVLHANTGDLLATYTLPVEDVILRIDAVSILGHDEKNNTKDKKINNNNNNNKHGKKSKKDDNEEISVNNDSTNHSSAPYGSYIAVGTRTLQVYVLKLDCTVPTVEIEEENEEEEKYKNKENKKEFSCVLSQLRNWTAAQQAISVVQFTFDGRYLISGSTDGGVKVWDIFNHHLTHNLRIPSSSIVHSVYVDPSAKYLCVGSFEGHITIFDFISKTIISHGRPHVAAVESLILTPNNEHLLSIGRDRKLSICTLSTSELNELRGVVVKEHVSCAVFESPFRLHIGAMDGTISTYSASITEPLQLTHRLKPPTINDGSNDDELSIRSIIVAQRPKGIYEIELLHGLLEDGISSSLYIADAAFNITFLIPDNEGRKYNNSTTLVGFLDQVLDVKLFPPEFSFQRIVVTNSKDVRCYNSSGCLSTKSLRGHNDIVLTCAISPDTNIVATAGKDCEIRFWSTSTWETIAIGKSGHDSDITSIHFNTKSSESYMVLFSVGTDENLRLWDVGMHVTPLLLQNEKKNTKSSTLPIEFTHRFGINSAHEGAIYTLAVAPNDQYVATAGKDKNIHLWNVTGKKLFRDAVLKGHRRAISSLVFSPTDRILASASNDGSIRLWSLVSLTCVKTLQVDRTPVLQVSFFNAGTQIITGNSEGVLRVWAIAASEVVWSGETHEDKIWALAVMENETKQEKEKYNQKEDSTLLFITGSADGVLMATEDYTAEEAARVKNERHEIILQEQELANALRKGEYTEAFLLALRLNHPRNLRQVIVKWSAKDPKECEEALRNIILPKLNEEQLVRLLQFTREWITNARHCAVASLVLNGVLAAHHFSALGEMPAIRTIIEALLAYMQRHSQRLHETLRRTYYIDYVTRSLGPATLTSTPPFFNNNNNNNNNNSLITEPAEKRQRTEVI